ncbi:OmpP1/FadL family transporter [Acinetobacter faecalis]|uniref:OmpP1/FadL family transporter n=1 Tax=Acinetobacter faecalis TaxID=2665161 RepID=UPI002A90E9FC|nr:transporter [Acinetobacter faecalis]MDY6484374.1 transporter [Acinetobacter faecalis]
MKLKTLSAAMILATAPMTGAFAAAMDRTGQSISAFLQPGNYAEAGLSVLDADVSGKDALGQNTGDMASSYHSASAALKIQATDKISVGLLFDQPFGAKAEYTNSGHIFSVQTPTGPEGTSAEVTTENLTLLAGFQPNANWNFYAGPVWQQAKGEVHLRSNLGANGPYGLLGQGAYNANMKNDDAWGWAAGVAYQIPEIALKASLTYRSEIKHELKTNENTLANIPIDGVTEVTTPQSVNLDFQTGIATNTVAFANVRWVNWDGFSITPPYFGQAIQTVNPRIADTLVEYNKDQWTINAGVGRKLTEKWSGTVSVGWDSGAGNPVSTLGPTEGYWSLGLGAQFSPATNYFIQGGVKYFWLGDAQALTAGSNNVGQFKDNHAIGYGMKIGYKF